MLMKNPFELLEVTTTEDEEQAELIHIPVEERHKKPHYKSRLHRKLPIESNNVVQLNQPVTFNEPLPQRLKCFHHYPYMENTKWLYTHKELTEGHYLDRQSGMGREDRFKKSGGGYHSVGNIKDQMNRQKYEREDPEENPEAPQKPRQLEAKEPVIESKVAEPSRITLLQYYHSKGIDLDSISYYKAPVKKTTIDKQWFKKERLNLLQTKEELKNRQRKDLPFSKHPEGRVGLNIDKSMIEKLGFGKQPQEQQPRYEEYRDEGSKNRSVLSTEDFPTL